MVKLTFKFNDEEVKKSGFTKDELLKEMREYAEERQIEETSFGVFEKDGEDALAMLMVIASKILCENLNYMTYLNELELDADDEKEDCIESTKRWLTKKRILR